MAGMHGALQCETDALILQITRLTLLHDRVRCLLDEAFMAVAIFDTFGAKYTDLLAHIKPLNNDAIVECDERAVEFDGVLEQLIGVFGTGQDAIPLIFASQELRKKPLPLATAILKKLANLFPTARAIAHCPADLNTCLEQALGKKDMLGLALLLADGRVDVAKHGLRIVVVAAQTGHMEILVQLNKHFRVPEILLIDDKDVRQAAFKTYLFTIWNTYGTELAEHIDLILALLASTLVGPGSCSDKLLEYFFRSQNTSALHTLLADARLDPSENKIRRVAEITRTTHGSAEHKHLLVNYANARPDVDKVTVLYAAIMCEDLLNIQVLLADPRLHFCCDSLFLIHAAILTGSVDVVSLFLSDGRINPAAHKNYALRLAQDLKNKALVNLLLADERVQTTAVSE